jgi:hypothetical protein
MSDTFETRSKPTPAGGLVAAATAACRALRAAVRGRSAEFIQAALIAIPVLGLLGYFLPPINHDAAALLDVSRRWINGEELYVDIIDVNMPLVFVLYAIPELLSDITGLSSSMWLTACFAFAVLASCLSCRKLLTALPESSGPLASIALPAAILFLLSLYPASQFGQREHLMLTVAFPYLLLSAARADGVAWPLSRRIAIAAFAGLGFAMKPHFALMPLMIEAYLLLRRGRAGIGPGFKDPVPWVIGGAFLLHGLIIFILTPQFVTYLLPLTLEFYSALGNTSFLDVLFGPRLRPTGVSVIILGAMAIWLRRSRLGIIAALFAVATTLCGAAQAKGWPYHLFPALASTVFLGAVVVSEILDRFAPLQGDRAKLPVAALTAALLTTIAYQAAMRDPPYEKQIQFARGVQGQLLTVIGEYATDKKVLVLSPGIFPHYPVLNYAGVRNTMRFQSLWLLQGVYARCEVESPRYNTIESMSDPEQFVFRTVASDFATEAPSLLIFDRNPGIPFCQGEEFHFLKYFMRNPVFAEAFSAYEPLFTFDRYTIYRRRG